jgi:hypothetical protein
VVVEMEVEAEAETEAVVVVTTGMAETGTTVMEAAEMA